MDDKSALIRTAVGRRLIAYLTILNSGSTERLRQFIAENYADEALAERSVGERLLAHQEIYSKTGKLRVYQVAAIDDHQAVLLVQAQKDGFIYLNEVRVDAEYPHKIVAYEHRSINEVASSSD